MSKTSVELDKSLSKDLSIFAATYGIHKNLLTNRAVQFALSFPSKVWNIKENKFIGKVRK